MRVTATSNNRRPAMRMGLSAAVIGLLVGLFVAPSFGHSSTNEGQPGGGSDQSSTNDAWPGVSDSKGNTAGYIEYAEVFAPPTPGQASNDGPFNVYSAPGATDQVVGVYFHSIGFFSLDEFNADSFDYQELRKTQSWVPTTVVGE